VKIFVNTSQRVISVPTSYVTVRSTMHIQHFLSLNFKQKSLFT